MLEALLRGEEAPVLLQGATGRAARTHLRLMRAYGTRIVAGVSPIPSVPEVDGVPVFPSCGAAVEATGAHASVVMVRAFEVARAVEEAVEAGVELIVAVTEGVPVYDVLRIARLTRDRGVALIGPSTPGIALPGRLKLGFLPDASLRPGPLAVMSKSGTLSYEICLRLAARGVGQAAWVGVGGDSVKGVRFADLAPVFRRLPEARGMLVVGEIGGSEEEELAEALREPASEDAGHAAPVFALLSGATAQEGVTMGHAGALIHGERGGLASKRRALEAAGARVFTTIGEAVDAITAAFPPASAGDSR